MPVFLRRRNTRLEERMDDPGCDLEKLHNTYYQFRHINALLSRSRTLYTRWLRPAMREDRRYRLLDIGFGGGDILLKLAQWAAKDGLDLHLTGVDIDPRACAWAATLDVPSTVTFLHCDVADLVEQGERFDFIIGNHMLHHLDGGGMSQMLSQAQQLCAGQVLFTDLARGDLAYALFWTLTAVGFPNSYIRCDGLTSLRRSYTFKELRALAPAGWQARKLRPFRLTLSWPAHT